MEGSTRPITIRLSRGGIGPRHRPIPRAGRREGRERGHADSRSGSERGTGGRGRSYRPPRADVDDLDDVGGGRRRWRRGRRRGGRGRRAPITATTSSRVRLPSRRRHASAHPPGVERRDEGMARREDQGIAHGVSRRRIRTGRGLGIRRDGDDALHDRIGATTAAETETTRGGRRRQ